MKNMLLNIVVAAASAAVLASCRAPNTMDQIITNIDSRISKTNDAGTGATPSSSASSSDANSTNARTTYQSNKKVYENARKSGTSTTKSRIVANRQKGYDVIAKEKAEAERKEYDLYQNEEYVPKLGATLAKWEGVVPGKSKSTLGTKIVKIDHRGSASLAGLKVGDIIDKGPINKLPLYFRNTENGETAYLEYFKEGDDRVTKKYVFIYEGDAYAKLDRRKAEYIEAQNDILKYENNKDYFSSAGDYLEDVLRLLYNKKYYAVTLYIGDNMNSMYNGSAHEKLFSGALFISPELYRKRMMNSRPTGLVAEYALAKTSYIGLCGEPSEKIKVSTTVYDRLVNGYGVTISQIPRSGGSYLFTVPRKFSSYIVKYGETRENMFMGKGIRTVLDAAGGCGSPVLARLEKNMIEYQSWQYGDRIVPSHWVGG